MQMISSFYDYLPELLISIPHRPDEYQVSMLQRLESAGEHVPLQPQIKTSYWTDALQHPTMSFQVRPNVLLCHCCVCYDSSNSWCLNAIAIISFHLRFTSDNLWLQNFMNDPINICTLLLITGSESGHH